MTFFHDIECVHGQFTCFIVRNDFIIGNIWLIEFYWIKCLESSDGEENEKNTTWPQVKSIKWTRHTAASDVFHCVSVFSTRELKSARCFLREKTQKKRHEYTVNVHIDWVSVCVLLFTVYTKDEKRKEQVKTLWTLVHCVLECVLRAREREKLTVLDIKLCKITGDFLFWFPASFHFRRTAGEARRCTVHSVSLS